MTDPRSLIDRVLDQLGERMQEHQPTLTEFSVRLEASAGDLIEAWARAYREVAAQQSAEQQTAALHSQVELIQSLFGQLKQGNLRQALSNVAGWSRALARSELAYDLTLQLVRAQQHTTLMLTLPHYSNDPQLPLLLDALDDWFDCVITLVGAAHSESQPIVSAPPGVEPRYADAAKLRVLGQLTGGLTHTLNDLFTTVIGQTQLLSERAGDYALRESLSEIQNSANVGARVVKHIQEYAGGGADQPQAIEVNAALRDAAEVTRFLWRDQAEQRGAVIDVVKDFAEVPFVLAAPAQLRQAFVALLLNAIEAMPEGGLITLRTERQAGNVLISIMDHGNGMSPAVLARAAEPFFTTRSSPHLGLGLSMVVRTITAHHGTLHLESVPGRGTTVSLTLPITLKPPEPKESPTMPAHQPAHVLVIDNESSVRTLLSRLLSIQGHTVAIAESGAEGIALFKRQKFDVVFTDLGMPEMSGWDVARELKKLDANLFIALTTGWPVELSAEELKARGVDQVVSKPFDLPLLYALVDQAVAENLKR